MLYTFGLLILILHAPTFYIKYSYCRTVDDVVASLIISECHFSYRSAAEAQTYVLPDRASSTVNVPSSNEEEGRLFTLSTQQHTLQK